MDNLIFSLNATIPVFLVMVLGYVLRRIGMLTDEFNRVANKFIFHCALPVLLFKDISRSEITEVFDLRFVLFCMIVTTICFITIWGGTRLWVKDESIRGAFVQASFRGSAAILGIAFIQNIYGTSGMAPLMIIGTVPLYNIYSVIVLTLEAQPANFRSDGAAAVKTRGKVAQTLINIITNPIILGILAGLFASLIGLKLPSMINKTVDSVASLATPLALVVIGSTFEGRKALAKIRPTIIATVIKLVIQAAVFLPIAAWMGFRGEKMVALVIMLAAPTTVSCYIMAKNMDNDPVLTSSVVVTTTLLSAFTITGWIYLLRVFTLI